MTVNSSETTNLSTVNAESKMDLGAKSPAELMDIIAGPRPARTSRGGFKASVNRIIEAVSVHLRALDQEPMKFSRAEDIWRGDATPRYWEMDAMRAAAAGAKQAKAARNELREIDARIERLERLERLLALRAEEPAGEGAHAQSPVARRSNRPVVRVGGMGR